MKNVNCFIGDLECKFERQLLVLFFFGGLPCCLGVVRERKRILTLLFCRGEWFGIFVAYVLKRIAVISPESWFAWSDGFRQGLSLFARRHTTLYNMVNILLRGVVLVNLGFHMCNHFLSMHIPCFRLREQQIHFGGIDLVWVNSYRRVHVRAKRPFRLAEYSKLFVVWDSTSNFFRKL